MRQMEPLFEGALTRLLQVLNATILGVTGA